MGLTGIFLLSFLCIHLYVNLFLLKSDNGGTYDAYAEFLADYPLVRPIEIVLFLGFLTHSFIGCILWFTNWRVRPRAYAVDNTGAATTLASRFAIVTGAAVLVFLVYHIDTFFMQSRFLGTGKTMTQLVTDAFSRPWVVGFYFLALFFLGYHLKHGFQSAFQTYGLRHQKYKGLIDILAILFWLIIPVCFAVIPAYFYWVHLGGI